MIARSAAKRTRGRGARGAAKSLWASAFGLLIVGVAVLPVSPSLHLGRPGHGAAAPTVAAATGRSVTARPQDHVRPSFGQVISTLPVGVGPGFMVFDNASGAMYLANSGSSNVSVIVGLNETGTIPVGKAPAEIAVDPANGLVYVANEQDTNVSVLSGTSLDGTVPVGASPSSIAVNTTSGRTYVTNSGGMNVSVISGTEVNTSIAVGQSRPYAAAYDPVNGFVYVADAATSNVSVIADSGLLGTVPVGEYPAALLVDPANGLVYVANSGSDNLSVLNGTSVVGTVNLSGIGYNMVYDPIQGWVYVAVNGPSTMTGIEIVNGTTEVGFVSLGFQSAFGFPEDMAFDPANGLLFKANLAGNVSVLENGVLVGSIDLGGASYVAYDPADRDLYVTLWDRAEVDVVSTSAPNSTISFSEQGLPVGTRWSVSLAGSTNVSTSSAINFSEAAGSYTFSVPAVSDYLANPRVGTVTANGSAQVIEIRFSVQVYPVLFVESGLPSGSWWTVSLGALGANSSSTPTVGFLLPNGTSYGYFVATVPGYKATLTTGTFSISGAGIVIDVSFLPSPLSVVAWANESASGGGKPYCVGHSGNIASDPRWENVSLVAIPENGTGAVTVGWSFGDGTPNATGDQVEHNYTGYGSWTVEVSVRDSFGFTNSTDVRVTDAARSYPPPDCRTAISNSTTNGTTVVGSHAPPLLLYAALGAGLAVGLLVLLAFFRHRSRPPPSSVDRPPR